MRRIRRVRLWPEIIIGIMQSGTKGLKIVNNALPADAEYIGSTFDPISMAVWLFISSAEFDEIGDMDVVPEHPPTLFENVDQ